MTIYLPYQQRVFNEKVELDEKITKLAEFKQTHAFDMLDGEDQTLLVVQHQHMVNYACVLQMRIDRFKPA